MRLAFAAFLLLLSACAQPPRWYNDWRRDREEASNKGLSDWDNRTNGYIIDKYGPPDRVETVRLVWENKGPWRRICVWDELAFLDDDRPSRNLEQTIAYEVPRDKRAALESFHPGLSVAADGEELSARSESEARNFLMLNLADEIVRGVTTSEDARASYDRTLRLADAGKLSPKMQRLLFR
jgi:hypothetical protein